MEVRIVTDQIRPPQSIVYEFPIYELRKLKDDGDALVEVGKETHTKEDLLRQKGEMEIFLSKINEKLQAIEEFEAQQ